MAVIYGINAVSEALRARPERIERVSVERGQRNPRVQEIVREAGVRHVRVSFEERAWMERKAAGARHQGVLAHLAELDPLAPDEILDTARHPGLLAVLDGVEDPHNLGAILRSAEASGVDGVFVPKNRSAGLSATVAKASAGAIAHVKLARVPNTAQFVESLKKKGYWAVGLDAGAAKPLWEVDLTVPTALVLGGEGAGMHRLVKEKCDFLASLPICGNVSSLNVSVAAGIAFYEVLRQRARR
ncbi:MAG: 23S rRNA (guanosine(2251)-2'-O)-methyltransferase RlmB [Acidobacteriota bacterium]|nr:23S rRNA (guanosine(2251)-2'-O)-methyltransferase RlmB [Acidobacteriota bacterium]